MKRKLVKQGAATMMISLPSKWIKANKLEKGDEINLEEKDNGLLINTEKISKEKREIKINLTEENKKNIKNILSHVYGRGFDKIILEGKHKDCLKEIKSTVSDLLLGFEVTEIVNNKMTIENISEPTGQKYDIMLKKTFQIIEETQDLVINDFEANNFPNFEDMKDLRRQTDRFILFCRRLLSKEDTGKEALTQWELLTFLMHIQHRYEFLYRYATENKIARNKEIINLLIESKEYFKYFKDAYYNKDINLIHKINDLREKYYFGKCMRLLEKSKGKESVIFSYIREIFRIIQIGTSPILSDVLEI
jgi:phosphate uptake regulator